MCLRRRHFSQRVAFVLAARQDLLGHSSTLNAKSPPATAPPRRPRSRASGNPSVGLEPRNAARLLVVYLSSPVRPGELSALGQPLNVQKLPGRRRSRGLPGFSQCPNANGARRSTRSQNQWTSKCDPWVTAAGAFVSSSLLRRCGMAVSLL